MTQSQDTFERAFTTVQALEAEVTNSVIMPIDDLHATLGGLTIGHVLFEGVPGTGKTELAKSLARAIGGTYNRVQGTPDVMPSDITGTDIYNPKTGDLTFRPGPIFGNVFLADEVNRMSTKSQSALLEAMQESQVTVGGRRYELKPPFMVLATQNPNEIGQGVNPLSKASLDRFAVGITMPEQSAKDMLDVGNLKKLEHQTTQVVEPGDLLDVKVALKHISVHSEHEAAAANLVVGVREHGDVDKEETVLGGFRPFGNIINLARYTALRESRRMVNSEDIRFAAENVLPHRVELTNAAADKGSIDARDVVREVADGLRI